MFAGDALGRDSVVPLIAGAEVGVMIGAPKDGALRRVVEQQGGEHLRIAAQKLTFGDINFVGDHVCEKEEDRLLTKVVICLCRTKDLRNNTLNLHAKKAFYLRKSRSEGEKRQSFPDRAAKMRCYSSIVR